MKFSREELQKAVQDARIELSPRQEEELLAKLEALPLAEFFSSRLSLKEKVPPTYYGSELPGTVEHDEEEPSLPRRAVLKNAPAAEEGCFLVPKIIE